MAKSKKQKNSLYIDRWRDEISQVKQPYYSTVAFEGFLKSHGCFRPGTNVLDVGSGIGANLHYFKKKNPGVHFLGIDYNPDAIELGKKIIREKKGSSISLAVGDLFNLPKEYKNRFDGIFNVHTLCCFKNMEPAIKALTILKPRWIAFNSLFFEGPLDVLIHIRDYSCPEITDDNPDGDFNIFSIESLATAVNKQGYKIVDYKPFYPPVALPRKPNNGRGSYTMRTELHERTQFSGPVYLPWYFVLSMKIC